MASQDASNTWNGAPRTSDILSEESTSDQDDEDFTYTTGDYSKRIEELFEEEDGEPITNGQDSGEEELEGFVYSGIDADASVGYREQLRDVLGHDHEDESESVVLEVERSLVYENSQERTHVDDELPETLDDRLLELSPAASSTGPMTPESQVSSPDSKTSQMKTPRPFLHATVSRLRSYTPQSRGPSNGSSVTSHSHFFDGASSPPSNFSSLSRMSSLSNLHGASSGQPAVSQTFQTSNPLEVFRWADLHGITQTMYSKASQKASSLLGAPVLGSPTVLVANGLICIGTTEGKVVVHDFNQTLLCVCDSKMPGNAVGAVTALALSHDHTFVASGHSTGYIQLYNLKHPHAPVRTVAPTTLHVVSSGRKEGHLQGSRIVSIGFVAGRHTALVSADDHGLAFFHSLGKVLFVEASDILRILGRYPEPSHPTAPLETPLVSSSVPAFSPATDVLDRRRPGYTVLSMAPLPLGTAPHPTDNYHVVALLTPTKLVVIGLKPTPRTWFKYPREGDEGGQWKSRSKWLGSLAWFPSFPRPSATLKETQPGKNDPRVHIEILSGPVLAFSWGSSLHLIKVVESRVRRSIKNSRTGKTSDIDVGAITYEKFGKWIADDDILAMQWLNHNQIIVMTRGTLGVFDLRLSKLIEQIKFDGLSLASPTSLATGTGSIGAESDLVAHSVRVYKGKLFLLKCERLVVGTLLTWADRILSFVEEGDFLRAIDLTRLYYVDEAAGNRNNLPEDITERKAVIGEKMRRLMDASAQYAFSEERMTDTTHVTLDNRGVDRTSLFEGLVAVCARASIALNDFEFLFEDLFQRYEDVGITSIYLRQLEPFVLDNEIRYVPPRITQRLVALHEQDGRPELVERIIWHMDPACLDLNQAIQLCQQYHLYDALIYIYTRAMRDYVVPVVELLGLIRKVQHFRKSTDEFLNKTCSIMDADAAMESIIINAYKIYPYLANVLSGLTYPSEEPLDPEEAFQAKKDIYTFLFFGRSSVWPPGEGEGGKLVLTSDEDGGVEPTYPYTRQLLLFDSESFLHTLDIAFEDAYLNDESQNINRLIVVRIILEIMVSGQLPQEDTTMINIFVARNVPKYPQFLQIAPSSLHNILVGLAQDTDSRTREDRQLAAEYLLSVYNPHDGERILELFEQAGFYRILRSWHYHEQRWAKLLSTYTIDPDVTSLDVLNKVDEVLTAASRSNKGTIPPDLVHVFSSSLPRLLRADVSGTALLVDKALPTMHQNALDALGNSDEADKDRYDYLYVLLGLRPTDEDEIDSDRNTGPSENVPLPLRQLFFSLLCRFHPGDVIPTLLYLPKQALEFENVLETCETNRVYDAIIWAINWQGDPQGALMTADTFQKQITYRIVASIGASDKSLDVDEELRTLEAMARISRSICLERSQGSATDVPLEDMWFKLLNSQIHTVQNISALVPQKELTHTDGIPDFEEVCDLLASLRSLVQATFGALVSITSTRAVSFPRLFKRLVNSTPSTASQYTEFRTILTGMLESYHSDEDLLSILKHLVERDLFDTVQQVTRERSCGWAASQGTCIHCRKPLRPDHGSSSRITATPIIISRTGFVSHSNCRAPPEAIICS